MELEKLYIPEASAGTVGQGPTICRGNLGVCGDGIKLPHAACRKNHSGSSERNTAATTPEDLGSHNRTLLGQKSGDFRMLEQFHVGVGLHDLCEAPDEGRPGLVSA